MPLHHQSSQVTPTSQDKSPSNQDEREERTLERPQPPKQDQETDAHLELSKELHALIKEARGNGHTIHFSEKLHILNDAPTKIRGVSLERDNAKHDFEKAKARSTIAAEFFDNSFIPTLKARLFADDSANHTLQVRPFAVNITQINDTAALVEVRDLLSPDAPKVLSAEIQGRDTSATVNRPLSQSLGLSSVLLKNLGLDSTPADSTPTLSQSYEKLVAGPIAELLKKKIPEAQRQASALEEDPQRLYNGQVRLVAEAGPDERQQEVIRQAFNAGYSISILMELNESGERILLPINPGLVAEHPEKAIKVDGEICQVHFHKTNSLKTDILDLGGRMSKFFPPKLGEQEERSVITNGSDDFDNPLTHFKCKFFECFDIAIKRDSDTKPGDGKRVITVGAPSQGVPELTGLLIDLEGQPVEYQGKPMLINLDPNRTLSEAEIAKLNQFDQGAQETLTQFGTSDLVSRILVVNSSQQNAWFRGFETSSLFVTDEMLTGAVETVEFVGRHEAIHLLDTHFENSLSGGSVAKLHTELLSSRMSEIFLNGVPINKTPVAKVNFFDQLNESEFLETGFGGHSQDNPPEFAASLINSLNHPQWECRVGEHSKEFQQTYHQSLLALREQLNTIQAVADDAPIRSDLDQKIDFLSQQIASNSSDDLPRDEREKFRLPLILELDEFILPPLPSGNNGR